MFLWPGSRDSTGRPPLFARWLLERALPDDVREDVSGDLEELFRRRSQLGRPMRARRGWRVQPTEALREQ